MGSGGTTLRASHEQPNRDGRRGPGDQASEPVVLETGAALDPLDRDLVYFCEVEQVEEDRGPRNFDLVTTWGTRDRDEMPGRVERADGRDELPHEQSLGVGRILPPLPVNQGIEGVPQLHDANLGTAR